MGREQSDDRVVPEGRRKASPTDGSRGGKAVTASEQAKQFGLFDETAENPKGASRRLTSGPPDARPPKVPKSSKGKSTALPPMTMETIADEETLKQAIRKVASNRGAPGPDRQSVEEAVRLQKQWLPKLQQQLLEGTYHPGDIRRVWIPKANGKQRGLGIPNVIDRVVQQAVCSVLSPNYEETFHDSSHGFRPRRSCHTAIKEATRHLEEGYKWVVDLDLEKFFDRVHHDRLIDRLALRIDDRRVLTLIRRMLRAKVIMPEGTELRTTEGTPQGGPLSPLLSNIVLDELDQELSRRGHRFVRYADDANIFVKSERAGERVKESITRYIHKRLRLKVNVEKSATAKPETRSFLGITLKPDPKTGKAEVILSKKARERIRSKIKELTPRNWGRSLSNCIDRLNQYLRGWLGYFAICMGTSGNLELENETFHRLDAYIRRRLRAIQLSHWKTRRGVVRHLIGLGVPSHIAHWDVFGGRRKWWSLTRVRAVRWGMRNSYFEKQGLFSLENNWEKHHNRIWDIGPKQLELPMG